MPPKGEKKDDESKSSNDDDDGEFKGGEAERQSLAEAEVAAQEVADAAEAALEAEELRLFTEVADSLLLEALEDGLREIEAEEEAKRQAVRAERGKQDSPSHDPHPTKPKVPPPSSTNEVSLTAR